MRFGLRLCCIDISVVWHPLRSPGPNRALPGCLQREMLFMSECVNEWVIHQNDMELMLDGCSVMMLFQCRRFPGNRDVKR